VTPASTLVARVRATRPGAVIASVVSWQGTPLPVAALFSEIRRALGARTPLLIADYTHAGAIGFPAVADLDADVVSGDPLKWLLPARRRSRLAFLWVRSAAVFRRAARVFAPLFLSIDGQADARSARWLDPQEVRDVAEWLADARLTRRRLRDRYQANLRLKQRVARRIGIASQGDSCVLWTDRPVPTSLESRLKRQGLLWRAADGYARILCRTDDDG
jgi:hypothetical protein